MLFQCRLRAIVDEGKTLLDDKSLRVEGASAVTLLLSAATSFNGFDRSPGRDGKDPGPIAAERLAARRGEVLRGTSCRITSPTISACSAA